MSRREIIVVCELAAHLAQRGPSVYHYSPPYKTPGDCAADAMALQRLGRRAIRNSDRLADLEIGKRHILPGGRIFGPDDFGVEKDRIREEAAPIVAPYGLKAEIRDEPFQAECLYIIGLPPNGDGPGFGI